MFEKLRAYCERQAHLTEEEYSLLETLYVPKKMKKGDFLLREGEVAKYGAFVVRGCLRSYTIDDKGREHILQFSPEDWWVGNLESYRTGKPSTYFVDAIEDSDVLLQDQFGFETMMTKIPTLAKMFHLGIQKSGFAKDKRIISALTNSAEERYQAFLDKYPSIAQRVPQHMLASFLGITPETLSRIRKLQSKRK